MNQQEKERLSNLEQKIGRMETRMIIIAIISIVLSLLLFHHLLTS